MRCTEKDYLDIGHDPSGALLWVHNGKIETREARFCKTHFNWGTEYNGWGRVDTAKKIGTITFDFTSPCDATQRKLARKIVQDVIGAFPGIKFRVYYGDGNNTTVQEFWEDTE